MPTDLTDVIETSMTDALDITSEEPTEQASEAPESTSDPTPEVTPTQEPEVLPTATQPDPKAVPEDSFSKKYGIESRNAIGKENRIPYSRVKKITEKAINDAKTEWEKGSSPKVAEFETRVKDYEGRLAKVAEFEKFMMNDQAGFLQRLATIPAYAKLLEPLFQPQDQAKVVPPQQVTDDMPQPDQTLTDGSKVYSMDGLKALLGWQAKQVEDRVTKQVASRYAPIESEWQAHQKLQTVIPQVQKQIDEARQWPQFNENEADIVKALQADQRLSLEGAYQKVVFPRLQADRNKMREELLAEMKKAPTATSAPSRVSKPNPTSNTSSGPRDIEDIIREAAQGLKR